MKQSRKAYIKRVIMTALLVLGIVAALFIFMRDNKLRINRQYEE